MHQPDSPIATLAETEYATAEWIDWYNHARLDYLTPTEYEQARCDRQLPVLQPEPAHP